MDIGKQIRKVRTFRKMTLEDVAKLLNSSSGTLSHIEKGTRIPSLGMLEKIAEVLEVPVGLLYTKDPDLEGLAAVNELSEVIIYADQRGSDEEKKRQIGVKELMGNQYIFESLRTHERAVEFVDDGKMDLNLVRIPVLNTVSDNVLSVTLENVEIFVPTSESFLEAGHLYFYYRMKDDSMNREFDKDSLILIQYQNQIKDNEICLVVINKNQTCIRKTVIRENLITLLPVSDNPSYLPESFDMKKVKVKILGKVVLAIKTY